MADSKSINSSSKQSKSSKNGTDKKKANPADDLKREKTLRKVLKEALQSEKDKVAQLELELLKERSKNQELEKEIKEKEAKFVDLYLENSTQHDKISELQSTLRQEREQYGSSGQQQSKNSKNNNSMMRDDSELIQNYEKRLMEYLLTIQKQERDISYKEEEIKSIKNIARDVAEQLEPVKKREEEFKQIFLEKESTIQKKDEEIAGLQKNIDQLKNQNNETSQENMKMIDLRLNFEAKIDKKDTAIHRLEEDLQKSKDEIKGKDEAIKALSMTLIEKGQENQKLTEMVIEIKNHHLATSVLGQKFLVSRQGTIKNEDLVFKFIIDKSKLEEFFLEISDTSGKVQRSISIIDIEAIEPIQGKEFLMSYYVTTQSMISSYVNISTSLFGKATQTLKEELYQSKHLAELKDAYEQILSIIERKEQERDEFEQRTQSLMEEEEEYERKNQAQTSDKPGLRYEEDDNINTSEEDDDDGEADDGDEDDDEVDGEQSNKIHNSVN